MPARLARSSVQIANPTTAKNKKRKRNLDAYAIAAHSIKEKPGLKQNRLGEFLDDGPKHKRRRAVEDEDGEEESAEEDIPSGKRRRTADEEDDMDEGSDSEGNEWRLGGLRSDDEDSELDSDEAFGESDEERFEGYTFRGSKSGGSKKTSGSKKPSIRKQQDEAIDIDLDEGAEGDESGEEDEDDFGEEGVDLATMLDDDYDEDDVNDEDTLMHRSKHGDNKIEDASMSEDDDGSASDEDSVSDDMSFGSDEDDEDDDQNDGERAARLQDFVEALEAKDKPKPRTGPTSQQLPLLTTDLLTAASGSSNAAAKARKKSARSATVAAPLPKRQQDRLNREVALQKAKEQLDRWRDTVIQNRRADFLSFPLKHTDESAPVGKDKFIVDNKPQNELEENIRRIMEESGISTGNKQDEDEEAAIIKSEELGTNHLPVEEVMRRRAELRRARELLFREEIKARRIAKIKSKSYRRVHRKERERQRELEAGLVDSDDDDAREANDRKRALARVSTKHRDSKFAKALKQTNRSQWDEGARDAVLEEASRREELKRRIRGEDVKDDEGSDVSSEGEGDFDGFDEDEDQATLRQLQQLKSDGADDGEGRGLNSLKFMRAADERRRKQNDEDVERIRKEIAIQDGDGQDSENEEIDDQGLGRAIFGPKGKEKIQVNKAKRPEMEEGEESGAERDDEDDDEAEIITERPKAADKKVNGHSNKAASGPLATGSGKRSSMNQDPQQQPMSDWLTAPARRPKHGKDDAQTTNIVTEPAAEAGASKAKAVPKPKAKQPQANGTTATNTNGWTTIAHPAGHDEEDASDAEPIDPIISSKESQKQSYIARAFAGDDTSAPFQAEKSALAEDEDEKEESTHLPGWGSWTGPNLSKSLRRANAKAKHNPLFETKIAGVKAADRKDRHLENVIISEKNARKGKGYLAPVLPHGFETREQYERSLGLPLGREWNTKEVFQNQTRPRVVVQRGKVVEALERPLV